MNCSNWIEIDENALIDDIRNTLTPEEIFDMEDIVNCVVRNSTDDEIIDFLKIVHTKDQVYKRILNEVIPIQLILKHIENISITKQEHSSRFTYLDVNDIEKYLTDIINIKNIIADTHKAIRCAILPYIIEMSGRFLPKFCPTKLVPATPIPSPNVNVIIINCEHI